MLYAHGFVTNGGAQGSNLRVGNDPIREHLIRKGFAWAASSYRCNGYVPGQGLLDTMALSDLFTKTNGDRAPQRTYLTGTSMGGHVTLLGMQEFPTAFAGGLAMCPAGSELFDYFAAVSAAAEVVHRHPVQERHDAGRRREDDRDARQAARTTPTRAGSWRASRFRSAADPGPSRWRGWRPVSLQNMSTSQAALLGSTTPGNRAVTDLAHRLRHRRRTGPDERGDQPPRAPQSR